MKTLHISVANKIATYQQRDGDIVCGNSDYQIQFIFDSEWNAYTKKTARFKWNGKHYDKDFSGNICPVPIITDTYRVEVGVFVENLETTTSAVIGCKRSILCGGSLPSAENNMDYANEAKEAAERATEDARAEVTRLVGEIGIVQNMGNSPTAVMSQKASTEHLTQHDKRLTNLEQGIPSEPFMTDASVAYVKNVPANALPYVEVSKVGGMIYYDDVVGMLFDAKVTDIESVGINLIPYPFDLTTLNGYGVSVSVDDSQRVVISGSPTSNREAKMIEFSLPIGTYSFSAEQTSGATRAVLRKNGEMIRSQAKADSTYTFTVNNEFDKYAVSITILTGNTYSNDVVAPMINRGAIALPYKPYTKHTITIPKAIQDLDGYGWGVNESVYNYIDFDKKQFVKRVGCVDMGTLAWVGFASTISHTDRIYKPSAKILTVSYNFNEVYIDIYGALVVRFYEGMYTSSDEVKTSLAGVMLYYELEKPEVIDISNILSADNFIGVDGGGTITAKQKWGYSYDVPSEITYMLKGE